MMNSIYHEGLQDILEWIGVEDLEIRSLLQVKHNTEGARVYSVYKRVLQDQEYTPGIRYSTAGSGVYSKYVIVLQDQEYTSGIR